MTKPTPTEILAFEATGPSELTKAEQIRNRWGISIVRYYQLLNAAIDDPHSVTIDPITTRRLIRQREQRTIVRATRRFTTGDRR